jgi:hypothetical protein
VSQTPESFDSVKAGSRARGAAATPVVAGKSSRPFDPADLAYAMAGSAATNKRAIALLEEVCTALDELALSDSVDVRNYVSGFKDDGSSVVDEYTHVIRDAAVFIGSLPDGAEINDLKPNERAVLAQEVLGHFGLKHAYVEMSGAGKSGVIVAVNQGASLAASRHFDGSAVVFPDTATALGVGPPTLMRDGDRYVRPYAASEMADTLGLNTQVAKWATAAYRDVATQGADAALTGDGDFAKAAIHLAVGLGLADRAIPEEVALALSKEVLAGVMANKFDTPSAQEVVVLTTNAADLIMDPPVTERGMFKGSIDR